MELPQIKYFINLADTLNFTEAAKLSNVAQPSLTKSIKKLEEELGGLLVFRDGKDTRLTALGREVLVEFMRIISIEEGILEIAESSVRGRKKFLNIGVATTISPKPISVFINAVLKDIPTLEVNLHPLCGKNGIDELFSGQFDACFLGDKPMEHKKLYSIALFEEEIHVAFSKTHRFASYDIVPVAEIGHEMYADRLHCEFRSKIIEFFMKRDILMYPRFSSEREDWIQQIVASGNGITTLPKFSIISDGIVTRPVENLDMKRTVVFTSISGSGNDVALTQMRMMVKDYNWQSAIEALKE